MRTLSPTLLLVAAALLTPCLPAQVNDATASAPDSASKPATSTVVAPVAPDTELTPADRAALTDIGAGAPTGRNSIAPTPDRSRAMSPETAAHLAERLPKFTPPPSAPPSKPPTDSSSPIFVDSSKAAASSPDLREIDKPRNTIIRLPNYVVQEEKPSAFKERNLLTPKGKLALAYKRYPGLKFGSLPFLSNDGVALGMLEDDFDRERAAEMRDLYTFASLPPDFGKAK